MYRLNSDQLKQLADFTSNLSLVFFTSVIAPTFSEVDNVNPFMIILGIALTFSALIISMFLLKGVKNES